MALTTAPTLPHLISKVLRGICLRFTRGTYFISKVLKSGGSLYFVAFSGVLLLGTLFIHSPLSGIQNPTWTVNLYLLLHYVHCT